MLVRDLGNQEVADVDEHHADDDGVRRGSAHPDRAVRGSHSLLAGDDADNDSKDGSLDQTLQDVIRLYELSDRSQIGSGSDVLRHGDQQPAADSDRHTDHGENRQHEDACHHSRNHQIVRRVNAEHTQCVDLLSDLHRADLGSHSRTAAGGDHDTGQNRSDFPDHRERNRGSDEGAGAVAVEEGTEIETEDGTAEKSGERDDGDGVDSDEGHLVDRLFDFNFSGKETFEGIRDEEGEFADEDEHLLNGPRDWAEQCIHTQ